LLPVLVFGAEVKRARVLQVGREYDGFVTGFSRKLDTEIPGIERGEGKFIVLGYQVLGCEGVEPVNGIAEGASVSNMLPCECS
jgi:hypothetical protein